MQNAEIKHSLIIYNKNPAGYTKNQVATVDSMFENNELAEWLEDEGYSVKWEDGIFEKLALNRKFYETELAEPLKDVRIWQLKSDFDRDCRFVSFDEMTSKHGDIDIDNYEVVFDGELQTNDLEQIYTIFNINHPQEYKGRSLSMADMVELYSDDSSSFHYVDKFGFIEVDFTEQSQIKEQNIGTKMGMQM